MLRKALLFLVGLATLFSLAVWSAIPSQAEWWSCGYVAVVACPDCSEFLGDTCVCVTPAFQEGCKCRDGFTQAHAIKTYCYDGPFSYHMVIPGKYIYEGNPTRCRFTYLCTTAGDPKCEEPPNCWLGDDSCSFWLLPPSTMVTTYVQSDEDCDTGPW